MAVVFTKTMYDQRRTLGYWALGIAALMLLMALLWPTVRDVYDETLLQAYPEELRDVFGLDTFGSGAGYLNVEVFSIMLPIVFIVFGIGRGARLIAGEEQQGVLEPVLVTPASRTRILLEKAAALAVGVVVLGLALFVITLLGSLLVDMEIPIADAAVGALSMTLLGLWAGWLALAIGAATGRRDQAITGASIILIATYVLHVVGALVEEVEPWRILSPITQAIEAGPLDGTVPSAFAALPLVALIFLALAVPLFASRDVGTS
jgi:ABC-2 type transport system permease protein